MPKNENLISYLELVKHIKTFDGKARLAKLKQDIEKDVTGVIYGYAKNGMGFIVKRYRTGMFVKKSY